MDRFKLSDISSDISSWKTDIQFPNLKPNAGGFDEIFKKLLEIDITKLDILSAEEYMLKLSAYSLYIQMEHNRTKAMVSWYESNLKHIVGKELQNVPDFVGHFFTAQDNYIRSNNPIAKEMDLEKMRYNIRLELIDKISQKLDFICNALQTVIYSKRKT